MVAKITANISATHNRRVRQELNLKTECNVEEIRHTQPSIACSRQQPLQAMEQDNWREEVNIEKQPENNAPHIYDCNKRGNMRINYRILWGTAETNTPSPWKNYSPYFKCKHWIQRVGEGMEGLHAWNSRHLTSRQAAQFNRDNFQV